MPPDKDAAEAEEEDGAAEAGAEGAVEWVAPAVLSFASGEDGGMGRAAGMTGGVGATNSDLMARRRAVGEESGAGLTGNALRGTGMRGCTTARAGPGAGAGAGAGEAEAGEEFVGEEVGAGEGELREGDG